MSWVGLFTREWTNEEGRAVDKVVWLGVSWERVKWSGWRGWMSMKTNKSQCKHGHLLWTKLGEQQSCITRHVAASFSSTDTKRTDREIVVPQNYFHCACCGHCCTVESLRGWWSGDGKTSHLSGTDTSTRRRTISDRISNVHVLFFLTRRVSILLLSKRGFGERESEDITEKWQRRWWNWEVDELGEIHV